MSKLPIRLAGVCSAVLTAALLAVPSLANATGIKVYSYAAKAVCEDENGDKVETLINIHNPSLTSSADFKIKIVEPDADPKVIACGRLAPDRATSTECPDSVTDFEGFVVVLSLKPLDVVGFTETEYSGELEDTDIFPVSGTVQTVAPAVWSALYCPAPPT